jgi:arylsulfatase A-like enzyme
VCVGKSTPSLDLAEVLCCRGWKFLFLKTQDVLRFERMFSRSSLFGPWKGLLSLAVLFLALAAGLAAPGSRPNILFIFSDDHSLQTIGAYNSRLSAFCREQNVTPNIDRLAEQGAVFENSFCGNSICSPSRASILSGLHSHANGVTHLNGRIRDGLWTFPPALRASGYQTALIGKWHLANEPQGFDFYRILPGQGAYWQPVFIGPDGFKENLTGYTTDIITEKSIEFLKTRDKTKPFLLMTQHKAPHRAWEPPTRYYRMLENMKVPEPETLFDDYSGRSSAPGRQKLEISRDMNLDQDLKVLPPGKTPNRLTPEQAKAWEEVFAPRNEAFRKANLQGRELTRWKYQEYAKDYIRCVKAVDDSVGALLDYLREEGLDKNTVVIYSSDQGFYVGEHGWFDKRWIYEESLVMPLIVRWPGTVKPGTRIRQLVQNIDYAPTLMEIAGGRAPGDLHGVSLLPLLRGENPKDWRRSVYYRLYDPGHGVTPHFGLRTERFTLAHFHPLNEWELFDLEKDPQQLRSVYADDAYARTRAELQAELKRLQKMYGDTPAAEPTANQPAKGKKKKTKQ